MKKVFISMTLVVAAMCMSFVSDLTGVWKGTVKVPSGEDVEITYHLKAEGEKLTGVITAATGDEIDIQEGQIKGNDFSFKLDFGSNNVLQAKGKLYADSIVVKSQIKSYTIQNTFKRVTDTK
ncbi:hypothetical protein [Desertivirga brevis]|uniref:hypothetical protein n=1 Tax=Desertivirga brevis TaxID=2810310 RepID=UPI001A95D694|nr:hypothetical protein [Pedobacter sp. SYSU D00873]